MIVKQFDRGLIIGGDHSKNIDIDSCVKNSRIKKPKVVLFEAPVNDNYLRSIGATEVDLAADWADANNVPKDTFDQVRRNRKSLNNYNISGFRDVIRSKKCNNELRNIIKNNYLDIYNDILIQREQEMKQNICYQIQKYGSPVLIIVGQLHVPNLINLLSE